MRQKRKRVIPKLPKGFTKGMKQISGDFLWGIWDGMSPGNKTESRKKKVRH